MTDGKLINHSNGIVVIKHIVAHTIDRAVHMHAPEVFYSVSHESLARCET